MKDFKIIWDKFKFPDEEEEDDDDENKDEEDEYKDEYSDKELQPSFHIGRILTGGQENPFVQLKTFNFWTAHTNFRLTKKLVLITAAVDGVESVDVITPYRFHISVGRAFEEQHVKREIYAKLFEFLNEQK